ncbi:MAG TPA: translational GTPase TypA, partial [Sutterellaceae bacterium]|nr:translational GTPase TypA [Sutterellaceae bacterium]
ETILKHCEPYPDMTDQPAQMQVSALAYDDYIGRLGIGRVYEGVLKEGSTVVLCDHEGRQERRKIGQVFVYKGLSRVAVSEAQCGEIVMVSGIADISIGDTLCDPESVRPLPSIKIEEPTLSMNFMVNTSPFAGRTGKYVTSRNLRDRLARELEVNVGLKVEETETTDCFKVSGRGELHLSILLENMRREGYELAVSRPRVVYKEVDGVKMEPFEMLTVDVEENHQGPVMEELGRRKGDLQDMQPDGKGRVRLEYRIPARGLIGFQNDFLTMTRGTGVMSHVFDEYGPVKSGDLGERRNGAIISQDDGNAVAYALWKIQERGRLFIGPGEPIYEGMVIGVHSRDNDIVVTPIKGKQLTNIRASGTDEAIRLVPPIQLTLESAVEFINDDELAEITPKSIRIRKRWLKEFERRRAARGDSRVGPGI